MTGLLDDILGRLNALPEDQRKEVVAEALKATQSLSWVPNPGPQTEAYFSEADETFYGGEAGGGKTDLLLGLSRTAHQHSLLLRRTNKEANGLIERFAAMHGGRDGWNSQTDIWRLTGGRTVEIGGCQTEEDKQKYKGRPHDLKAWDEVSDFSEAQFRFINTWNRSATPGQRCRVVAAGNPPTRPEGLWVIRYWAPWLDPKHPRPAKPGELRWFLTDDDGNDIEVEGPGPHLLSGMANPTRARSRTFIRARLSDNPDLDRDGQYAAVLDGLPAELKAAYRDGKFDASLRDDPWQIIPTPWVRAAQARWKVHPPEGVPMCAIGVDVAQGGNDNTVLAPRHDGWFPPLISVPGRQTPDGKAVAGLVVQYRRDNAEVVVDVGGGWGGDAYGHLKANQIPAVPYMGVKPSHARTTDKQIKFFNKRAEIYWRFREALDPSQPGGSPIALPDDAELVADLTAVTYEVGPQGLKAEAKDKLVERLGRSPDKGDAVVMSWSSGPKGPDSGRLWSAATKRFGQMQTRAVMSRTASQRR